MRERCRTLCGAWRKQFEGELRSFHRYLSKTISYRLSGCGWELIADG
jgi:hypothetical protein